MTAKPVPCGWSSTALFAKAQVYAEQMQSYAHDDWRFVLWSTLVLELLARASLGDISPCLLADSADWSNLLYSLGHEPKAKKFVPRSVDVTQVLARLQELLPEFTQELRDFCALHMARRNEELHSGDSPFNDLNTSDWLPKYYRACKVLLTSIGLSLEGLVSKEESAIAEELIKASLDESAKSVAKSIRAHELVWSGKTSDERHSLSVQALSWASKTDGHRVKCPACKCTALLTGSPSGPAIKTICGDEITEKQEYLPSKFECIACGLKISGLSQLNACQLGDHYTATFVYNAEEYYRPEDPFEGFEPDFNEF